MLLDPGMHRNRSCRTGINRASRAELGNGQDTLTLLLPRWRDAQPFLPEEQDAGTRQRRGLQLLRTWKVVDPDDRYLLLTSPGAEGQRIVMMRDVEVAIGHHCSAPIPPAPSDDMDGMGREGICRTYHRSDVEVVVEILDRDVKLVTTGPQIRHDRVHTPIAVAINHIAAIALREQLWVPLVPRGPRLRMRANADRFLVSSHAEVVRSLHAVTIVSQDGATH